MPSGGEDLLIGTLRIAAKELSYEAVRSGGPGGQNVNKVASQVQLRFNIPASASLNEAQRELLLRKLDHRLTNEGDLLLRASRFRERGRNLEDARERLARLLESALREPKRRRSTKPTRGSRERRLRTKKHRSDLKKSRRQRPGTD